MQGAAALGFRVSILLTSREPPTARISRSDHRVSCRASIARIPRRRWGPLPPALAFVPPTAPATPAGVLPASSSVDMQQATPQQERKPAHDVVDAGSQALAINLSLEDYRQALLASGSTQQQQPQQQQPAAAAAGAAPAREDGSAVLHEAPAPVLVPSLSHPSLAFSDLEGTGNCGMPACQAARHLQLWQAEAPLKPPGFDTQAVLRLEGVADVAAASSIGLANGGWKPDNQDAFLIQALPLQPSLPPSSLAVPAPSFPSEEAIEAAAGQAAGARAAGQAAAIGVFDGHGRLGAAVAGMVRHAMAERLEESAAAATQGRFEQSQASDCLAVAAVAAGTDICWQESAFGKTAIPSAAARARDGQPSSAAAQLLGSCFAAAEAAVAGSGLDLAKSGCTAVLVLVDRDRPEERQRICAAGGRVARLATDRLGKPAGPFRVFVPGCWSPGLALSRAFGDTLAASVGVTCQPDITVLSLSPPSTLPTTITAVSSPPTAAVSSCCSTFEGKSAGSTSSGASSSMGAGRTAVRSDACSSSSSEQSSLQVGGTGSGSAKRRVLIVATDGLWEWVSNTAAVGIAASAANAEEAAQALVEAAQKQWAVRYRGRHCDDVTVVVAFLGE